MKKLIPLSLLLLVVSCSTYIPIEYYAYGDAPVAKGTALKIKSTEQAFFEKNLAKSIEQNGWWKLASDTDKDFYEFTLKNISRDAKLNYESSEMKEGKKIRKANFTSEGKGEFVLRKNNEKNEKIISFEAAGSATTEKEMPKDPGSSSLRPLMTMLTGYDERDDAKEAQNTSTHMNALDDLNPHLVEAIIKKITPEKIYVDLLIEDDADDMNELVKLIDKEDFDSAINYVTKISENSTRSDAFYNLGVLQEYRQMYPESCLNYQKAYDLVAKALYLKEKTNCLIRQAEFAKVSKL